MRDPSSEYAALQQATNAVNAAARVIAAGVVGRYRDGACEKCGGHDEPEFAALVAAEDKARAEWQRATEGRVA